MKEPTLFRVCKKCGQSRHLFDFHVYNKAGNRRHECRSCYRARMNVSYLKNRETRLANAAAKYAERPSRQWTAEEKRLRNERGKQYRIEHMNTIFDHYGRECVCCGETEPMFLTIDHVNGDGASQRKDLRSGVSTSFYRWIIKKGFPDDLQVLCYNCNCGRARNGGICPHNHGRFNDYSAS